MQPNRGFSLGRPLGSTLLLHGSFIPACGLLAAHLAYVTYADRGFLISVALGLLTALGYVACVLLHALAHIVVGRITGARPQTVTAFVFGDVSSVTAKAATSTALAGPFTSALLAAAAILGSRISSPLDDVLRTLGLANAAMAALNLLPALPFDGGHILGARGSERRKLAIRLGRLAGLVSIAAGALFLLRAPDLLPETSFGLWLVLAGLFVIAQSNAPLAVSRLAGLRDQKAGDWATPFVGRVDADAPAPTAGGPYAVSESGRLTGVLTTLPGQAGARAADLMVPWTAELNVRADASLTDALEKLASNEAPVVVVVDRKGVVRGIVDEDAVRARLFADGASAPLRRGV